ncbi:RnfH family protein [Dichelobacter nodosus]|uniref:Protein RnfH n=1 Tax=Dichelobacter nodosus (strain VCS1703A) TaxID=246195 RepID=A5EXZ3_DICNV|nr:RnfH family protein [Dichelobacter nodosus]ABQ13558.1 conserved hypothetical protein [Dichelobacter nodosus VCS1703A]AXM45776.1 RnfH family protein [Dichelobacter nodosus]KNZ39229.1 hypothetical protein AKG33_05775 [Dichelobacter nodosus]TGA64461.1 RnfH family protein [Dichelobacter nodosus]
MAQINVEIVYATAYRQKIISLAVEEGTTAQQAVLAAKIADFFPEIDLNQLDLGIFSQPCRADTPLRDGDRVEIYRPLRCDPKEMRRQRARR